MLEEWMASSQDIPTIEGYAEDICSVANHFEWQGLTSPSWPALEETQALFRKDLLHPSPFSESMLEPPEDSCVRLHLHAFS